MPGSGYRMAAIASVALLSAILVTIWAPLAALDVRGAEMSGIVTGVHGVRLGVGKGVVYHYALRDSHGSSVPGTLREYDDVYAIGDEVDVVVDGRRKLDPVDAGELDAEFGLGVAVLVGVLLTVVLSIAAGSGVRLPSRSRYRPRH
jgi:hypothetical protein